MKHLKTTILSYNEGKKSSDYNIYKIKYYADAISVRKGKFPKDDETHKQHHERAIEYNKFFWDMVEQVTCKNHGYWIKEYMWSCRECVTEELHEKYGIIIPEGEEYYFWYIPKELEDLSNWIEQNCKLPFKKLIKAPMSNITNREVTTWRREEGKKTNDRINQMITKNKSK